MSWRKHLRTVNISNPIVPDSATGGSGVTSQRQSSYLPEVYCGHPSRISRYYQFQDMDQDCDINAALDTIADFCTQSEEQNEEPFEVSYNDEANETEITLIKSNLKIWVKLNDFKKRLWHIFRSTIRNGDSFFLVDPETFEWLWVDHFSVEMVKVDETKGKEPDEYIVRGLDINRQGKFATVGVDPSQYKTQFGTSIVPNSRPQSNPGAGTSSNVFQLQGQNRDPRQQGGQKVNEISVIDAKHMVHLSLSVGMDLDWPFGKSILEPVFKIFKQKELLEDSILIYRVMRAPERRVFKIDVGSMPPYKAKAHIEQIKNEIHQRRIPGRTQGGGSVIDAAYSPLSMLDDYYFAISDTGRGSSVEVLPGGECFDLSTRIPLLDGRTLTLSEIIEEHNAGKQLWAYSIDPKSGKVVPGMINWAGKTRLNAKVMRITFDNGKSVVVTPDHKFPLPGKEGFTEARDLQINDSLFSFETREKTITKKKGITIYTQVFDHEKKDWLFAHRMVAEYFRDHENENLCNEWVSSTKFANDTRKTVHHLDFNRHNNSPENLTWMNSKDHFLYHSNIGVINKKYWDDLPQEDYERICKSISDRIKTSIANKTPEELAEFHRQATQNLVDGKASERHLWLLQNDPEFRENLKVKRSATMKEMFVREPERKDAISERTIQSWKDGVYDEFVVNQTLKMGDECWKLLEQFKDRQIIKVVSKAIASTEFMTAFHKANENTNAANLDLNDFTLTGRHLAVMAKKEGKDIHSYVQKVKSGTSANFTTDFSMLKVLVDHYKNGSTTMDRMSVSLNEDTNYKEIVKNFNPKKHHLVKDNFGCLRPQVMSILNENGFESWKHFKDNHQNINHRITFIEYLEDTMDTGTITIDGAEIYHNYHTFALECGVYVLNSLGEIGDLSWFAKKMARGLRIPTSYLSLGDEESGSSGASYNDGKLGAAVIQEYRFNKYCMRLQSTISPSFDDQFKRFLKANGIEIEDNLFELRFNPPQNFTKYRQIELDAQQVGVYQQIQDNKKLSERFKLKRFLNLNDEELLENERMWAEENADKLKKATGETPADENTEGDLGDVGFHMPEGGMDDMGNLGDDLGGEEGGPPPPEGGQAGPGGAPGAPPDTGGQPPM